MELFVISIIVLQMLTTQCAFSEVVVAKPRFYPDNYKPSPTTTTGRPWPWDNYLEKYYTNKNPTPTADSQRQLGGQQQQPMPTQAQAPFQNYYNPQQPVQTQVQAPLQNYQNYYRPQQPMPAQAQAPVQNYQNSYWPQQSQPQPQLVMAKPLFTPTRLSTTTDDIEEGGIHIPDMGGIEYYDLVKRLRTMTTSVKDAAVQTPGNVAGVIQTAWKGSSSILSQVRDNMPEMPALPSLSSLPYLGLSSENSYSVLPPFPYFKLSSSKRQPVENYWLDNYGV